MVSNILQLNIRICLLYRKVYEFVGTVLGAKVSSCYATSYAAWKQSVPDHPNSFIPLRKNRKSFLTLTKSFGTSKHLPGYILLKS